MYLRKSCQASHPYCLGPRCTLLPQQGGTPQGYAATTRQWMQNSRQNLAPAQQAHPTGPHTPAAQGVTYSGAGAGRNMSGYARTGQTASGQPGYGQSTVFVTPQPAQAGSGQNGYRQSPALGAPQQGHLGSGQHGYGQSTTAGASQQAGWQQGAPRGAGLDPMQQQQQLQHQASYAVGQVQKALKPILLSEEA